MARTVTGGDPQCTVAGLPRRERERKRLGEAAGDAGGARLLFIKTEERGKTLPRRTVRGRRLLRRRARAVAEPRGEGDGADRWDPGWQRLGAGGGAGAVGGRVGRRGLLGRTAEARDRAGAAAGLGCGAGPRGKKWPWGRKSRKRGKEEFFLFFFQTNFPKAF